MRDKVAQMATGLTLPRTQPWVRFLSSTGARRRNEFTRWLCTVARVVTRPVSPCGVSAVISAQDRVYLQCTS